VRMRTWVEVTLDGLFPGCEPLINEWLISVHLTVGSLPLGYPEFKYSETAHGPDGKRRCVTHHG
jgi:hypothetical protein